MVNTPDRDLAQKAAALSKGNRHHRRRLAAEYRRRLAAERKPR